MVKLVWVAVLWGLMPGCESSKPPRYDGTDAADGSRLAALHFSDASSGQPLVGLRSRAYSSPFVRTAQIWFDRELGQRCRFEAMEDRSVRCVPDAATLDGYDEICLTRVARVAPGCDVPAHAFSYNGMFALGEKLDRGFFIGLGPHGSRTCTATSGDYYRATEPVENSLFVSAAEAARPGIDLDFGDLVADDGAHELAGASWHDGTPVKPVRVSPTEMELLPDGYGITLPRPEYLDPSCSRVFIDAGHPGTMVNVWFATDPCRPISCLRSQSMTVDTVYVRQGGACVAVTGQRDVEECTDLAAPMPRFSIEVLPGTGRLRPFDYVSAAGDRMKGGVFDTEADASCTPTLVDDGARAVCVPDGAASWNPRAIHPDAYGTIYSDAACSQEAFVAYACGGATPITADETGRWCREPVAEVGLHTSVVTAPLYVRTATGCIQYEPAPGVTIYDSSTVPVTDLPELTLGHR